MDPIKEAFTKVKQDISILQNEIISLSTQLSDLNQALDRQTDKQTDRHINQTDLEEIQTDNHPLEALKSPISEFSTGNEGVQTDRQTNRQTDRHIENTHKTQENDQINNLQKVSEILASLDEVKKEVRVKFKKLTNQEMAVFSAIYSLEEKGLLVDYPLLAQNFSLSESAIRDYINKIIQKGIPLHKTKENNKKITLNIDPDLKKIADLAIIQHLRDL